MTFKIDTNKETSKLKKVLFIQSFGLVSIFVQQKGELKFYPLFTYQDHPHMRLDDIIDKEVEINELEPGVYELSIPFNWQIVETLNKLTNQLSYMRIPISLYNVEICTGYTAHLAFRQGNNYKIASCLADIINNDYDYIKINPGHYLFKQGEEYTLTPARYYTQNGSSYIHKDVEYMPIVEKTYKLSYGDIIKSSTSDDMFIVDELGLIEVYQENDANYYKVLSYFNNLLGSKSIM
jgi:hypothetical protein